MPDTVLGDYIHATKYRGKGESFREWANRVASALKDDVDHYRRFRDSLLAQRFLPAGRVQSAAGSPRRVTAFNCYVAPTIEDSFTDGPNSIMAVAGKAAQTMRMGGGIGYDFSTLRPEGALIRSLDSQSSGPLGFMPIYDAICKATSSAGNRRGAQMAVLRIDHPDIEAFIRAKQNATALTGFNISIAVTDAFMKALRKGKAFTLKWDGRQHGTMDARSLWEEVMRSTWDWAEPGVLFVDTINRMNNLWYCEKIAATNPCGEQPLPPNGACLLGSFNLTKYVEEDRSGLDFNLLIEDVYDAVRAMDNVIDRTIYPLPEQEREAKDKRRMGLGVTGLANALEALGRPYGSPEFIEAERMVLSFIRDASYMASARLASEKGSFPVFRKDKYLAGEFIQRLPETIQDMIARYGIRNSHLTSIAPTGSISLAADNVSSGIEPVYMHTAKRTILGPDGPKVHMVEDYGLRVFGVRGKAAEECTLSEHLDVMATAQEYVDSAVSKTINVDPSTPWEDFKAVYTTAYERGCKGITTFNPKGKRMGIFEAVVNRESPEDTGGACYIDPNSGIRTCDE